VVWTTRLIEWARLAALLLVAVALQGVAAAHFSFLGVTADLFLIVVVLVALSGGAMRGLIFGFVGGLLADVVFLDPMGVHALMYLLAGYGVGRYVEEWGLSSAWVVVLLTAGVSLATQVLYGLLQVAVGTGGSFLSVLLTQMLPAALVNGLLAAPLHLGLTKVRLLPQSRPAGTIFG
jgi:rod shape-determining protein MreD